ncbi:MAG: hypothetical protein LBU99_07200 [Spirochaetaceae bacterium]|jgi:hypothetical protein|nr:hypothetical protein [Spirochaetaceae bacterium]
MPLLQVRDFPDDVYDEIMFEARQQNRTIAQQTIILIKKGLGAIVSNKERRRLAIERTLSRTVPENAKTVDYIQFIREDRDR